MLSSVLDFFGRFHPVVVHLPIGILLLAAFFQLLSSRYLYLKPAIPVIIFWGTVGAIVSCITGYLLSLSGDYDMVLTGRHQWMGILTAAVSGGFYYLVKSAKGQKVTNIIAVLILILVTVTGHLGGALTHGSDYLTASLGEGDGVGLKPIANVQEAVLYTDIVQPILKSKCYSCHGASKQRGKLRLDEETYLMAGGENGAAVAAGKPDESELIKRLLLPLSNDEHMPPKEKPQLSQVEIALLNWWVHSGADFEKQVKDLEQPEAIKPVLSSLQSGVAISESPAPTGLPGESVGPADESALMALRDAGVVVMPTAKDNNYLTASFFTVEANVDSIVRLLHPIRKQLVWLRLDDSDITDEVMDEIAKLPALTRLYLTNTKISDKGIAELAGLKGLQVLNLVNTPVSEKGVLSLKGLQDLRAIYLYKSHVDRSRWSVLKEAFPKTVLDSGGYQVPILPSDTTLVTP